MSSKNPHKNGENNNLEDLNQELPADFFTNQDVAEDEFENGQSFRKNNYNEYNNEKHDQFYDLEGDSPEITATSSNSSEEEVFALPSELDEVNPSYQKLLVRDGYFKKHKKSVLKRNSKLRTGSKEDAFNNSEEELKPAEKKFIGRKGAKTWSKKVSTLKKRFGFSWHRTGRKFLIFGSLVGIFLVISLSSVAAIAIDMWNKTESIDRLERKPAENSVVYARDGKTKIFEFFDEERREVIEGSRIPLIMKSAVIALEDENFYENQDKESWQRGIPWSNLGGALFKCMVSGGDQCRGASGISQQLIKNMTGDDSQDVDRKVRELFRAIKLNQEKTPDEILSAYLNWVPFGRNAYGVQEASKAYFNKAIDIKINEEYALNPVEACYLSAIINRPGYYQGAIANLADANKRIIDERLNQNIQVDTGNEDLDNINRQIIPQASLDLENRKNECLIKLNEVELKVPQKDETGKVILNSENQPILTNGKVIENQEDLEKWINTKVIVTNDNQKAAEHRKNGGVAFVNTRVDDPFPHFREYMTKEIERVVDKDALNRNGYDIVTTLDPNLQREVDAIVKSHEQRVIGFGADNAAALVLDGPTGEILSMVGSFGYDREDIDGKFNVTSASRQPGSSIKPFVYMAAFKNGFNPGNFLVDVQTSWNNGNYTPKNFDGRFRGPVTMRRSLQGSLNIPAVKALFLVDDRPVWDQVSKMNTFFNFTGDLGLKFPCIEGGINAAFPGNEEKCRVDPERGITQEMIDNAARTRCGISIALGGCEVTMVSHTTAYNTIMQEGKLRTATPFVSVKEKNSENDIYKIRQESEAQPFPTRDPSMEKEDEKEKILLARQMAFLMTDYESRIPEFGQFRFNLEPRNYGARVASKTGTSNGPKDFWTCGGSSYYTVCIWVGRTDNQDMRSDASSGVVASLIWRDIMEKLHEGKEAKPFSSEGLTPAVIGGSRGKLNEETGEYEGGTPGRTELLTPKQNNERFIKSGVVALNSPEDVSQFKKKDIFENRSSIITASYFINSLDGGLFIDGKTLESNKKEVVCNILIGEFPDQPNWYNPVASLAENSDAYCKLPQPSEQDQYNDDSKPKIETNFFEDILNDITSLWLKVEFPEGSPKKATKLSVSINGKITSIEGSDIRIPVLPSSNPYNIILTITDNLNQEYQKTYQNIRVGKALTGSEISNVTCTENSCNFTIIDTSRFYEKISIKVAEQETPCNITGGINVNCSVESGILQGQTEIQVIIDGDSYVKIINL